MKSPVNRPLVVMVLLASVATACGSTSEPDASGPGGASTSAAPDADQTPLVTPAPLDPAPVQSLPVEPTATPTTAPRPGASTSVVPSTTTETPTTTMTPTTTPPFEAGACVDDLDVRARVALLTWPAVYAETGRGRSTRCGRTTSAAYC